MIEAAQKEVMIHLGNLVKLKEEGVVIIGGFPIDDLINLLNTFKDSDIPHQIYISQ